MDLYFNGTKHSTIPVVATTTIGEIKKTIRDWLLPQGIAEYKTELRFNDGTMLNPIVFSIYTYDNTNFQDHAHQINGSIISISAQKATLVPPRTPKQKKHIYVLFNPDRLDTHFDYVSESKVDVLRWYMDNYILNQYPDSPEDIERDYDLRYPLNYSNPQTLSDIEDIIRDTDIYLIEGDVEC